MYSGGEKGLEACYALPGFDAQTIARDFTTSDVNNSGKVDTGEVWFKGEATKKAYECYTQLSRLVDGFTGVFAQKKLKVSVFDIEGKAKEIAKSTLARIEESPHINSTYSSIRIDIHVGESYQFTVYRRDDGKAKKCSTNTMSLDEAVETLVKLLETDSCENR